MAWFNVGHDWDGVSVRLHGDTLHDSHVAFICANNPADGTGTLNTGDAYFRVDLTQSVIGDYTEFKWKFATFSKSGTTFTVNDSESTWHVEQTDVAEWGGSSYWYYHASSASVNIDIDSGDYIGIIIERNTNDLGFRALCDGVNNASSEYAYESSTGSSPYSASIVQYNGGDAYDCLIDGICESGSGGSMDIPNTYGNSVDNSCNTYTSDISVPGWYNNYAYVYFNNIYTSPYRCDYDINLPWLEEKYGEVLEEGVTRVYRNPANMNECYSITFNSLFVSGSTKIVDSLTDCWYYDSYVGDVWVSADDGDDSALGRWASNPYKTITKGLSEVATGRNVFIEHGIYLGESGVSSISNECNLVPLADGFEWSPSEVVIVNSSGSNVGQLNKNDSVITFYKYSFIDTNSVFTADGRLLKVTSYLDPHEEYDTYRVVVFRDDGTNYVPVDYVSMPSTGRYSGLYSAFCDIDVQAGDMLGIALVSGGLNYFGYTTGTTNVKMISGDKSTTTTPKSSWSDEPNGHMRLVVSGIYIS